MPQGPVELPLRGAALAPAGQVVAVLREALHPVVPAVGHEQVVVSVERQSGRAVELAGRGAAPAPVAEPLAVGVVLRELERLVRVVERYLVVVLVRAEYPAVARHGDPGRPRELVPGEVAEVQLVHPDLADALVEVGCAVAERRYPEPPAEHEQEVARRGRHADRVHEPARLAVVLRRRPADGVAEVPGPSRHYRGQHCYRPWPPFFSMNAGASNAPLTIGIASTCSQSSSIVV